MCVEYIYHWKHISAIMVDQAWSRLINIGQQWIILAQTVGRDKSFDCSQIVSYQLEIISSLVKTSTQAWSFEMNLIIWAVMTKLVFGIKIWSMLSRCTFVNWPTMMQTEQG